MSYWFLRLERITTHIALILAIILLVISVSLGFFQVITRFVFDAPSTWSEVAARSAMIWCVFLGAAPTFRAGAMMAVEIIYSLLPRRLHLVLESLIAILCLIFLFVIVWFGTAMTFRVWNQTLAGLEISIAWAYVALPIGSTFAALAVIGRYLELWQQHSFDAQAVEHTP